MFSKNIILLMCVVGFAADDGTSWVNINPNLNSLTTEEWKEMFYKYDTDNSGSISATELQKLLYKEFKVFITVRHAEIYSYLINFKKNHTIGLEQVKKMKPIIFVLSQRKSEDDNENLIENNNVLSEDFVNIIGEKFQVLFVDKKEVLEVLKIVGHDEKLPIESTEYHEILKMLPASKRMADIYWDFNYTSGSTIGGINFDFLKYIQKHRLFTEIPGSLIFKLNYLLKCVICH
ncbi:uncharacterized protein LOC126841669 [Adelges cooleyi]|uniref:uncharacterized protein LOC126841669 n=1 Tax=Adelges cooleyi TaxID=133065 RepID=UPI0021804F14|nr:uncharacterized protein LOC126841669 [Adelges cooleyi]XP_050434222.1 uncharacterized protein LOC126841669 [Adelges cooleyi]